MRDRKCPNCDAALHVWDEISGKIKCPYCGFEGYADDYRETQHKIYTNTAKLEEARNDRHKFDRSMDFLERERAAERSAYAAQSSFKHKAIAGLIICALVILVCWGLVSKISHRNDIRIGTASSKLLGEEYTAVSRLLIERGFENIEEVKYADLTNASADMVNRVSRISINGTTSFGKRAYFPKEANVTIEYHTLDPNRPDEIKVPQSHYYLVGKNFTEVQQAFEAAGFTDITLSPVVDVNLISKDRGLVSDIYVDGSNDFSDDTWVNRNAKILITFHATKGDEKELIKAQEEEEYRKSNEGKILIPQAAKKYVGMNYEDVETILRSLGFSNIEMIALGDIKKDIFNKENEIDEITINGDGKFKENTYFDPDAKIVIKYHSRQ